MTPEHLGIGLMGNGKAFTPGLQLFHRVLEGVKINYQSQIISNKNMIWIDTKIKKSTTTNQPNFYKNSLHKFNTIK